MYKLVVLHETETQGTFRRESVYPRTTHFVTQTNAVRFAEFILKHSPNDICMLVGLLETGKCGHCGEPVHENPGWVVVKWRHDNGTYSCYNRAMVLGQAGIG